LKCNTNIVFLSFQDSDRLNSWWSTHSLIS